MFGNLPTEGVIDLLVSYELPHHLVGEVPGESEHSGVGEVHCRCRRTGGQPDEDARCQQVKESSSVNGHDPHLVVYILRGKKHFNV